MLASHSATAVVTSFMKPAVIFAQVKPGIASSQALTISLSLTSQYLLQPCSLRNLYDLLATMLAQPQNTDEWTTNGTILEKWRKKSDKKGLFSFFFQIDSCESETIP